jgi:putative hemolysin
MTKKGADMSHSRRTVLIAVLALAACTTKAPPPDLGSVTPQSAAQNCETLGGKRRIERGADGEIAVCVFPNNRQCEEWALLLGDCARGGIEISGYATTSERHCAIRGGRMTIPGCELSPIGLYEARNVVLLLQAGNTAMLRTYTADASRYLMAGTWARSGSLLTVSTEPERMVLEYAGDRLIPREWDRKIWGAAGPGTLMRQK